MDTESAPASRPRERDPAVGSSRERQCETSSVLGLPIAVTDYDAACALAVEMANRSDRAHAVAAANTHLVTEARRDAAFGRVMANFDLILPDGMPLVWCINRSRTPSTRLVDRVYGPTFMLRCIEMTQRHPRHAHFFLGSSHKVLAALTEKLGRDFPKAKLAGTYSPPWGAWPADEEERIAERIRDSGANHIWIALGCPKQETWIARRLASLPVGVYYGVGAAFAQCAGLMKPAPPWMQQHGLEWIFRLLQEPRRLAPRYLFYNPLFISYVLKDWLRAWRRGPTKS